MIEWIAGGLIVAVFFAIEWMDDRKRKGATMGERICPTCGKYLVSLSVPCHSCGYIPDAPEQTPLEAPERIWAFHGLASPKKGQIWGGWNAIRNDSCIEYVRADLYDALEQAEGVWYNALVECRKVNERLRAAIREEADDLAGQLTGITGAAEDLREGALTPEMLERLYRDCSEYVVALRALTKPEGE